MSDSKQLFVTASFDGQFKIWDSNTKCEMASAYLALSLVGAKFAMHDSLIVAFNRENIFVYNIAARVTNSTFSDKDGIDAIDVLDNNLFYLTHTSGTVKKISLKGNHAPTVLFSNFDPVTYSTHDWLHTETLQALRVIRNKKLLASVSTYSNELVIYDITNDRKLTEWSIHDKSQIVTKPSMDIDEIQSTINFACGDSITRLRYSQDGRFEMQHIFTKYAGRATLTGLSCVSSSGDIIAAGPGAPGEKKIFILHPSGNIETAHFDSSRDFRILSVQFNPVKNEILAGGTDGSLWTIDMDSHVADLVIGRLSWITNIFSAYDSAEIFIARVGTDGYQIEKRQKSSLKVNTRIYTNFEAVYPLSANQFLGIRNDTVELDISGNNHLLYYSAPIIIPDSGVQQSTGSKENVSFDRFAADTTGNIFYFFFNDPLNKIHFFNVSQLDTFRKKQIYLDKGYEHVEENSMAFGAAQLTGIKASASGDHLLAADINHILYYINQITSKITK